MICWKIRIFAYWTTPLKRFLISICLLWFAEKFVSLLIEQHLKKNFTNLFICCDLLKNSYLCLLNNTKMIYILGIYLLWFAEKFVSLLIEQHPFESIKPVWACCDLLKNSYLCLLNNTHVCTPSDISAVVICWKIRIFAYWTTPQRRMLSQMAVLWFAEKFVSLLIEQHQVGFWPLKKLGCDLLKNSYLCLLNNTAFPCENPMKLVVICWKIRIFAYWTTPLTKTLNAGTLLWFAEKFVSLLIEQHHSDEPAAAYICCDLLKNSYLCLLNNTININLVRNEYVVICWKIRIFAYWTTPGAAGAPAVLALWFAEKFVSLLIEQHPHYIIATCCSRCDLLKNSYLCLLNNTKKRKQCTEQQVVICWKIRIFAYWTTPLKTVVQCWFGCDLLKNSYLCLLNNTWQRQTHVAALVVICWKIRIFAYWTTPLRLRSDNTSKLWFAEKFVSLLIEQHRPSSTASRRGRCDLLKNSYLCLLNNTGLPPFVFSVVVVICWKIRIFAYWTTPLRHYFVKQFTLWFAEKFVSLLIEQHHYL